MSDQKKILHDDSNGLDYVLVEDYYLPVSYTHLDVYKRQVSDRN